MREILFRGKRVDNGEWIYGCLVLSEDYVFDYSERIDIPYIIPIDNFNLKNYKKYRVGEKTIGQYTGLFDKNGKKIFEGDILREYGNDIEDWVVSYDCGKFVGSFDNVCEDLYEIHDLEVIGNIYDKRDD